MKNNLLTFIMVLSAIFVNAQTEIEPNNTSLTANTVLINNCISDTINPSGDQDWFVTNISQAGVLQVNVTNSTSNLEVRIRIYDSDATTLITEYNPCSTTLNNAAAAVVPAGTYYVLITDCNDNETSLTPFNTCISLDTTDALEFNQTSTLATPVPIDTCFQETISGFNNPYLINADQDWYVVNVPQAGVLLVSVTNTTQNLDVRIRIYESNATTLLTEYNSCTTTLNNVAATVVPSGTYYILITDCNDNETSLTALTTCINLDTTDALEFNQTSTLATPIPIDTCFQETIYGVNNPYLINSDQDWYVVHATQAGVLLVNVTNPSQNLDVRIRVYDFTSTVLIAEYNPCSTSLNNVLAAVVDTGTYYILITDCNDNETDSTVLNTCINLDTTDSLEFNQTSTLATPIPIDTCFQETIWGVNYPYIVNADQDWFVMQTTQWSVLNVTVNNPSTNLDIRIRMYDSSLVLIKECNPCSSTLNNTCSSTTVAPGTYYILITDCNDNETSSTALTTCINSVITSVNTIESNNILSINPNPVKDLISIQFSEQTTLQSTVSIINLLGEKLYQENFSNQSRLTIDVRDLPSAIYFVQVENENGKRISKKFIKE